MYDVHSFFERKPDRARHWIHEMWRLHPGWPIWGLKLAQLLARADGPVGGERSRRAAGPRDRGGGPPPQLPAGGRGDGARPARGGPPRRPALREGVREAARGIDAGDERSGVGQSSGRRRVLERCRGARASGRAPRRRAAWLCSLRRAGCASRARCPRPRPRAARAFRPSPRARGPPVRGRESLRRAGPRRREPSRGPWSRGRARRGFDPSPRLALARALEGEGDRAGALDVYRSAWEEPLGGRPARRGGRGDPAARPRRRAPRRAAARAIGRGSLREIWYSKYRTRTTLPVLSPTFSSPKAEGTIRTVGSRHERSREIGSKSRFARFPHRHAQPKPLHTWSIGRREGKVLDKERGVPTLPVVCEAL